MPAGFEWCVKHGGRVRTMTEGAEIKKGQYRHVCFLKGKSYLGELKTKKEKSK